MNISETLAKLDKLPYTEIETFLEQSMLTAIDEGDTNSLITLLNEIIGFCRDTCQHEKAIKYSGLLLQILAREGITGNKEYATSLVNVANAYRAAGKHAESLAYYEEAYAIFERVLPENDFLFASINNNMALLYQEMNAYDKACECLERALSVVDANGRELEHAITLSNLAESEIGCGRTEEAREHITQAIAYYEDGHREDFHYGGALSVLGKIYYLDGKFADSAQTFYRAAEEMQKHTGDTDNCRILRENAEQALKLARESGEDISYITVPSEEAVLQETGSVSEKGLDLCEQFYLAYGKDMIHEKFPLYESRIAVGLVGEGSDCFGFDDAISRDHDWGPGFCLWLDDETYDEIGEELAKAYDALPKEYKGYTRTETAEAKGRVGVMRIRDFYARFVGDVNAELESMPEDGLATATNGKVFRDDADIFTAVRNRLLAYYPESIMKKKLAYELILMSKAGQYNLLRTIKRGDTVTATMYFAEYCEHTLKVLHILNRKYAPYKKWLKASAGDLTKLPEISDFFLAMTDIGLTDARIPDIIEIIAKLITEELREQGFIKELHENDRYYIEPYGYDILRELSNSEGAKEDEVEKHKELVEQMVLAEWQAFDKVKNEGGRASCQDDWGTFSIMRRSQYLTWTDEMIESYLADFAEANARGWNLITEKYGRMEVSTAPEEYEKIKASFPERSEETIAIVETIVGFQVGFMEELAKKYPKVASTARSIHTYEDTPVNTSYETYLRGELLTYSPRTLSLYGQFIVSYLKEGKNLAIDIMTNTALLYGYESLDDLEAKLD